MSDVTGLAKASLLRHVRGALSDWTLLSTLVIYETSIIVLVSCLPITPEVTRAATIFFYQFYTYLSSVDECHLIIISCI